MSQASRAFDALVQEFYEAWFRFHPERALQAGISGYEGRLPAIDDDDSGALGSLLESLVVGLEEMDFHGLDDDRQIDLQILFGAAQAEHQCLLQRDWRHRDPGGFLPFGGLRELLLYPRGALKGALQQYLSAVPEFLRLARSQLRTVPELVPRFWCEAAVEEAQAGTHCLLGLRNSPVIRRGSRNPAVIEALVERAAEAVHDFAAELQQDIAPLAVGDPAAGRALFAFLLRQRFFLTLEPEQLMALAARALHDAEEEVAALGPADSADEAGAVRDAGGVIERLRDYCHGVQRFVEREGLVEVPLRAQLRIAEAPAFLSPLAELPTYVAPPMGDPELVGTVYVDCERAAVSVSSMANTRAVCLRFGWAGRHLQAVCAAGAAPAGTLVRRLNTCAGFIGGWPLYAEGLLVELGYDPSPHARRAMLLERQRCALLAVIDAQFHMEGLGAEQAVERLAALPGVGPERARRQVLGVSREPGRALAALTGWRMIETLRDLLRRHDRGYAADAFHHRLLAAGPTALPLVIQSGFGQPAWDGVVEELGL
ncbi:MAG: DUF885 family protein [Chromatiales bacterium]|jgi:hypothetical protein